MKSLSCLLLLLVFINLAQAKLVQQVDSVNATVTDAYGKRIERSVNYATIFDDTTPSPRPVLILNHGRSYKAEVRAVTQPSKNYAANARWFAQAGFFVVIPTRIGYGSTGGDDVEDSGVCSKKNYPPGYMASAEQTLALLAHVRSRADVSQHRGVVMGQSYGGTTAITVAAKNPAGVQAFVNFAGGGGGNPETQPQRPCRADLLYALFAGYGKTSRGPTLWVYTENDQYSGPKLAKEWFDAFVAAGGTGEFVLFPPLGTDGHSLFTSSPSTWRPRVTQFLKANGFVDMTWGTQSTTASVGASHDKN
ncbi:MAG: dienelactone hydrolase [Burkholderiales bacterium]|nr:MAG: dienelactone hydrolase [Burkholderiales bacterium]